MGGKVCVWKYQLIERMCKFKQVELEVFSGWNLLIATDIEPKVVKTPDA
jgi:hypothetical protein